MIKIIVNGATGKMGSTTVNAIKNESDFKLVAELDSSRDLSSEIKTHQPDIVIDFTSAHCVYENSLKIIEHGARPVIGSSGLTDEQIQRLCDLCQQKNLGGIIAPNFSIGAILMMRFAKEAANHFQHAEIIELHHAEKKDAPSGTAMKTAKMIADVRKNENAECKELITGALGAKHHNIPVHSIRLPGLLAHQEVIFGGLGETLTIRHDSTDRQGFMPGVILACRKAMHLNHLIYGLENLL